MIKVTKTTEITSHCLIVVETKNTWAFAVQVNPNEWKWVSMSDSVSDIYFNRHNDSIKTLRQLVASAFVDENVNSDKMYWVSNMCEFTALLNSPKI
jgi:hypothetical protein